ncbi:MAG: endonuclease/exonuclease/phosphatase family protein [Saprospiraceae bacterium]|nr:endonuclease/exonuclease/phosphatase family protein [Saprospiraceae bacterium]
MQYALAAAMIAVALLCMFTPDLFILKRGANFTVQIMLMYMVLGMLFLVVNRSRLMFIALGACGCLCLYLKGVSDQRIKFPSENANPQISVAHINLSLSEDYAETMRTIWSADVDVISFQEYTPDWHDYLLNELSDRYPFKSCHTRIDPYGMAMFSKYPIDHVDTFHFGDVPNLHAQVSVDESTGIHLISAHTAAPVNSEAYATIRAHFREISNYLRQLEGPVITLGDFNLPSWSSEIKEFKSYAGLNDSRRDIVPASLQGTISLLKIPIDHILYSDEIECTAFRVLASQDASHLGIFGKYQMKQLAALE